MSNVDTKRLLLRARGRVSALSDTDRTALMEREPMAEPGVAEGVASLMDDVRFRGDAALIDMAARFDGVGELTIEVPKKMWHDAVTGLDPEVRAALERAADNIRCFHAAQRPDAVTVEVEPGVRITRSWVALERVGVYAPGGTASYPSSVLMGAVPARAAGVDEVVVCSPPGRDGRPSPAVLAACEIAGADRLYAVGGAGAIAALAYGTQTVTAVDAIVGPGNRWVTEAKRQVAGRVVIDSPAGPSEVLVLADDGADPTLAAHEIMAQAEHDRDAACVVVATDMDTAERIEAAVQRLLADAPRAEIVTEALAACGAILVADTVEEALRFTDDFAPEHLSIMTRDAAAHARALRNSGTTFVGPSASVAFGDYMTGANHVLPTAGRSRSFSGLSTHHFLRSFTIQEIDAKGAASLSADVARLAEAEGLPAHAAAANARQSPRRGEGRV